MLLKYRPEDKAAKKERLLKRAQAENEGKTVEAKKPIVVKYGLNHVTYLIEQVWTPIWFLPSLSDSRVLPLP
jgi:large subunit ribosomal protein L7Ae